MDGDNVKIISKRLRVEGDVLGGHLHEPSTTEQIGRRR
jgi:hypothetical protein